jgi:hypothetical protein
LAVCRALFVFDVRSYFAVPSMIAGLFSKKVIRLEEAVDCLANPIDPAILKMVKTDSICCGGIYV